MQGNPRAICKRAIERGNVVVAEMTARELGRPSLDESLALTGETTPGNEAEAARLLDRYLGRADTAAPG